MLVPPLKFLQIEKFIRWNSCLTLHFLASRLRFIVVQGKVRGLFSIYTFCDAAARSYIRQSGILHQRQWRLQFWDELNRCGFLFVVLVL
jgi:hypothetical protein